MPSTLNSDQTDTSGLDELSSPALIRGPRANTSRELAVNPFPGSALRRRSGVKYNAGNRLVFGRTAKARSSLHPTQASECKPRTSFGSTRLFTPADTSGCRSVRHVHVAQHQAWRQQSAGSRRHVGAQRNEGRRCVPSTCAAAALQYLMGHVGALASTSHSIEEYAAIARCSFVWASAACKQRRLQRFERSLAARTLGSGAIFGTGFSGDGIPHRRGRGLGWAHCQETKQVRVKARSSDIAVRSRPI